MEPTVAIAKMAHKKHTDVKNQQMILDNKLRAACDKMINLKVHNETQNQHYKECMKKYEDTIEKQKKAIEEQQRDVEKLREYIQNECRLRDDTINRVANTREMCATVEEHLNAMSEIIACCQRDRQSLSESYEKAVEFIKKNQEQMKAVEGKKEFEIGNLNTKLKRQQETIQIMENARNERNQMTEDIINSLYKKLDDKDEIINGIHKEKEMLNQKIAMQSAEVHKCSVELVKVKALMENETMKNTHVIDEKIKISQEFSDYKSKADECISQMKQEIGNMKKEAFEMAQVSYDLRMEISQLLEKVKSVEEENENNIKLKEEAENKLKEMENKIKELESDNSEKKDCFDTLLEEKNNQLQTSNKMIEEQIEKIRMKDEIIEEQQNEYKKRESHLINEHKYEVEMLVSETKTLREIFESSNKQTIELKDEVRQKNETITALMNQVECHVEGNAHYSKSLREKDSEIDALQEDFFTLKQDLKSKDCMIDDLIEEKNALKKEIMEMTLKNTQIIVKNDEMTKKTQTTDASVQTNNDHTQIFSFEKSRESVTDVQENSSRKRLFSHKNYSESIYDFINADSDEDEKPKKKRRTIRNKKLL